MNDILLWALQRLREPSTYLGLTTILSGLGLHAFMTDHGSLIGATETVLAFAAGIGLVVVKERRTLTPSVVVEDVANAISQG